MIKDIKLKKMCNQLLLIRKNLRLYILYIVYYAMQLYKKNNIL